MLAQNSLKGAVNSTVAAPDLLAFCYSFRLQTLADLFITSWVVQHILMPWSQ